MKKSILYIHGFASGPGQKAKDLQKAFPDHDIVSPQLSGQINLDMFNLKTYLFDKSFDFDAIVGTSLGGFYALALRTEAIINIPTYVINPALSPHITLAKYVGKSVPNHKTGEMTTIYDSDLAAYKKYKLSFNSNTFKKCKFFIGTKDDVLDFEELFYILEAENLMNKVIFSEQNHRHQDISNVIDAIKKDNLIISI